MSGEMLAWIIPLAVALGGAVGWLIRQFQYQRKVKRQAANDASEALKGKKVLLEELVSKEDDSTNTNKENLISQLEDVNAALLGLYSERIRRTLTSAGLPAEELLITDGRNKLQQQQVQQLKEQIAEVKSLPLSDSIQKLSILASAYYYAGQYDKTLSIINRSLELSPDRPDILTNRGITLGELERYEDALTDFNRSLELRPDDPTTLMNRGVTLGKLGRYDDALSDYNHSLKLRPDHPYTLMNRGITLDELGRYDDAISDYNRSLELKPNHPYTLINRGATLYKLGRYDDALSDYNRSLELKPDYPPTLMNRGVTYHHLKRYDYALSDYNRSLELRPDHPATLYNLACLFSIYRDTDESIRYLEKAIKKDENYREMAKNDEDFDNIRNDPRFRNIVGLD